jgi:hypothetical protein
MRILYGEGFGEESRLQTAGVIISNLVGGTRTVLENCDKLGHPLKTDNQLAAAKIVNEQADDTLMTDETAAAIKLLWESQPFQETYKLRSKFQLFDCYGDFAKSLAKKYPAWGGPAWYVFGGAGLRACGCGHGRVCGWQREDGGAAGYGAPRAACRCGVVGMCGRVCMCVHVTDHPSFVNHPVRVRPSVPSVPVPPRPPTSSACVSDSVFSRWLLLSGPSHLPALCSFTRSLFAIVVAAGSRPWTM